MSRSNECMARMSPTGQCSIQLVGVVSVDMLIDCLDSDLQFCLTSLDRIRVWPFLYIGQEGHIFHQAANIPVQSSKKDTKTCLGQDSLSLVLSVVALVWELNRNMEASGSRVVSLEIS